MNIINHSKNVRKVKIKLIHLRPSQLTFLRSLDFIIICLQANERYSYKLIIITVCRSFPSEALYTLEAQPFHYQVKQATQDENLGWMLLLKEILALCSQLSPFKTPVESRLDRCKNRSKNSASISRITAPCPSRQLPQVLLSHKEILYGGEFLLTAVVLPVVRTTLKLTSLSRTDMYTFVKKK